jgi:hypothetical protein
MLKYGMMKIMCVLMFLLVSHAQAETYIQINGVSLHDRSGYNSFNYGAGVEQAVAKDWTVSSGWYYNSERRGSTYAYGRYAVYQKGHWDIGLAMGAVTGYRRAAVVPMAFPDICYSWLCAVAFPRVEATGANVVGLRLRIPVN